MRGGQKLAIYSTVWAATEVDVPCRNPALNPAVKHSKSSQVRGAGHQVENITVELGMEERDGLL